MNHLNRDELLSLLRIAKNHSERDWLLLLATFWHGLRASEATGLTSGQISDGYIAVQRLKGSLKTRQPLVAHKNPLLDGKTALEQLVPGCPRKPVSSQSRVFNSFGSSGNMGTRPDCRNTKTIRIRQNTR